MHLIHRLIYYLCTQSHKVVYYLCDILFIARDRISRDYDKVHRSDSNVPMLICRHSCKRRHRLTLTSRCDDDHFFRCISRYSVDIHKHTVRHFKIAKLDAL